jgi:hypothetical protein
MELMGFDRLENGHFRCGINYIDVFANDQKIFNQQIKEVNLSESRSIYGLMDFKTMRNNGSKFYKLYVDDGNTLNFYKDSPANGKLRINTNQLTTVKIIAKDIFGNASEVTFKLKSSPPVNEVIFLSASKKPISYDIQENTLSIFSKPCAGKKTISYNKGIAKEVEPDYANTLKAAYLFDLRKSIPDSINVCGQTLIPNIRVMVPPNIDYKYYSNSFDISFSKTDLFDTLYLNTNHQIGRDSSEIFTIGNPLVPLARNILVSLKPTLKYSTGKNVAVYRVVGKGFINQGGRWVNGQMQFVTRELGNFTILKDTIPPTIRLLYCTNQAARFKIADNLSGISSFEATINGQWLLMNYDAKSATIMSERLNKNQLLSGNFELIVTDNAGNKSVYKQKI